MSKFKVGDKVKCIKASECGYPGTVGETYVVCEASSRGLFFQGSSFLGSDPSRFELVEAAAPTPTVTRTVADLEDALGLAPGDIAKEAVFQALGTKRQALYDAAKVLKKAGLTVEADRLEAIAKGVELSRSALR